MENRDKTEIIERFAARVINEVINKNLVAYPHLGLKIAFEIGHLVLEETKED